MIDAKTAPYAALILRLSLGIMYLTHSVLLKWMTFGLAGTAQFFGSLGLPPATAYLVIAAEIVGGALLVLGLHTRAVALALMPILLGAAWTHWANGWVFSAAGGGWEYPMFLAAVSVALAMLGDGAYALKLGRLAPPRSRTAPMAA